MGEEHHEIEISIKADDVGGVWSNVARVSHSPYEFTLDFARIDYSEDPPKGVVVSRVNMSPLMVSQLIDALQENWRNYAQKALPPEVGENDDNSENR